MKELMASKQTLPAPLLTTKPTFVMRTQFVIA